MEQSRQGREPSGWEEKRNFSLKVIPKQVGSGPGGPAAGEREMESVVQTRGTQWVRKDKAGEALEEVGVKEVNLAMPFCLSGPPLLVQISQTIP